MEGTWSKKYVVYVIRRMHFLGILTLGLIWSFQVYSCIYHYKEEPRYFEQKLVPQTMALYPAITICPNTRTSYGYKDDVLKVLFSIVFLTKSHVLLKYNFLLFI